MTRIWVRLDLAISVSTEFGILIHATSAEMLRINSTSSISQPCAHANTPTIGPAMGFWLADSVIRWGTNQISPQTI